MKTERIINGNPLLPVNKQAIIVTSKAPKYSPVSATFHKDLALTEIEICKTNPPDNYAMDKRGWIFHNLQIFGYAYSNETVRQRIKKPQPKPTWWVGPGWNPVSKKKIETERRTYWWVICLHCKRVLKTPWSNKALNKYLNRSPWPICAFEDEANKMRDFGR
jgi:hypothetical protein